MHPAAPRFSWFLQFIKQRKTPSLYPTRGYPVRLVEGENPITWVFMSQFEEKTEKQRIENDA
jgi:hypothetical protein